MFRKLNVYVGVIAFGLLSGLANAVTLEDVSFSSLSGDRVEVTLSFDGQPPEPTGYTIERPARIAVDLPMRRCVPRTAWSSQSAVRVVVSQRQARLLPLHR